MQKSFENGMRDGVLIVDKPAGMSSAQVVGKIKRCLRVQKVGHAGTLDPFATGVLVCLINRATRLAQFLLAGKKEYHAILHLGVDTDTQDVTGQVVDRQPVPEVDEALLQKVFSEFIGTIEQKPPVYSALKHKGVALYKLARRGCPVQKPARKIHIEQLAISSIDMPEVSFSITCSAGTYIRTLCADIGQRLGCGGYLRALRRTKSSGFGLDEAIRLEMLNAYAADAQLPLPLIPPGDALRGMPTLRADRITAEKIKCGGTIDLMDFTDLPIDATVMTNGEQGTFCKVFDSNKNLIAIVSVDMRNATIAYSKVFA